MRMTRVLSISPDFLNTGLDWTKATLPDDPEQRAGILGQFTGFISAWDPVAQKEAWRVQHSNMWNGGMLSTAGNLVFQGNAEGQFASYRADNGERLWTFDAQTGIVAAPHDLCDQWKAVRGGDGRLGRDGHYLRGTFRPLSRLGKTVAACWCSNSMLREPCRHPNPSVVERRSLRRWWRMKV